MSRASITWLLLGAILILQVVLADRFAQVMPWRTRGIAHGKVLGDLGAPDERAHANLIGYLLRDQDIPALRADDPNLGENYECHQAPLYYHLTARMLRLCGATDIESQATGLLARRINIGLGCLNTLALFCLGAHGFRSRFLGLAAASLMVFLPMWLAVSASVNNDALLCGFINAALAAWFVSLGVDGWKWQWGLLGVGFAACAIWTKTSGILVVPAMLLAAGWWSIQRRKGVKSWVPALACCATLVLVGPLLARNQRLYGDVLGQKVFNQAFASQARSKSPVRSVSHTTGFLYQLVDDTQESAFGVFGYYDIHYPSAYGETAWLIAWPVCGIGVVILAYGPHRRETWSLATLFWLNILGYVMFNVVYKQPQGRYLYPGFALVTLGLAAGSQRICRWIAVAGCAWLLYISWGTPNLLRVQFKKRIDDYQQQTLSEGVDVDNHRSGVVAPSVNQGSVDQLPHGQARR